MLWTLVAVALPAAYRLRDALLGNPLNIQVYRIESFWPLLAVTLVVGVFALAGLPPFAGFMGKLTLLTAALDRGHLALVVLAVVNTAIATARDPEAMGRAFDLAVKAGRAAYLAELAEQSVMARASSPLTGFLDD